jgi:AcrR family transcriptional regulator
MRRRTAEDTRRLILDAGLQLLLERGASAGVQHIRLQEVLRNVGLTTGAAYRIWTDQTDFHRDLAIEAVRLRFAPPASSARHALQELVAARAPLDDLVRAAAADHVAYAEKFHLEPESRDSHAFITALALRTAAGAWPELRQASAERHEESVADFAGLYGELMRQYGYRLRHPFTITHFAEAMAALGEGFAVRAAVGLNHPLIDVPEDGEWAPGHWTLFGIAMRGLIDAFMIPDDGADDRADAGADVAEPAVSGNAAAAPDREAPTSSAGAAAPPQTHRRRFSATD